MTKREKGNKESKKRGERKEWTKQKEKKQRDRFKQTRKGGGYKEMRQHTSKQNSKRTEGNCYSAQKAGSLC